jgi:hypothetical protein
MAGAAVIQIAVGAGVFALCVAVNRFLFIVRLPLPGRTLAGREACAHFFRNRYTDGR